LVTQNGGDVYALDDLTDPSVSWDSQPVKDGLVLLQKLSKAGVFIDGINGVSENKLYLFHNSYVSSYLFFSWMNSQGNRDIITVHVKTYFIYQPGRRL